MSEMIERELGWEDIIENDGADFVLLPAGEYKFRVVDFERSYHNGSDKIPACKKAIVHLVIDSPQGQIPMQKPFFLHSKFEWALCSFFTAIGLRKRGEKFVMKWSSVVGSSGRCELGVRSWTNNKGEEGQSNEIKKFLEPAEDGAPAFVPGDF